MMKGMTPWMALAFCTACVLSAGRTATTQEATSPERFSATVVDDQGRGAFPITIAIDHWSADTDRDALATANATTRADELMRVFRAIPKAGEVRSATGPSWALIYARRVLLPGGAEHVVVAAERPRDFWERAGRLKSGDYPFTVIDLRVNPRGDGTGSITLAAQLALDKETGVVAVDPNPHDPIMLQAVKREQVSD